MSRGRRVRPDSIAGVQRRVSWTRQKLKCATQRPRA